MNTLRFLRNASWPVKSASTCGRSETSSSARFSAETRRRGGALIARSGPAASLRQLLQSKADQRRGLRIGAQRGDAMGDRQRGLRARVAEIDERGDGVLRALS